MRRNRRAKDSHRSRDVHALNNGTCSHSAFCGNAVPKIELYSCEIDWGSTKRIKTGGTVDDYVFNIRATTSGKMLCTWLDRKQKHLKELLINPKTGNVKSVVERHHNKPLIRDVWPGNEMRFLKDQHRFLCCPFHSGTMNCVIWMENFTTS